MEIHIYVSTYHTYNLIKCKVMIQYFKAQIQNYSKTITNIIFEVEIYVCKIYLLRFNWYLIIRKFFTIFFNIIIKIYKKRLTDQYLYIYIYIIDSFYNFLRIVEIPSRRRQTGMTENCKATSTLSQVRCFWWTASSTAPSWPLASTYSGSSNPIRRTEWTQWFTSFHEWPNALSTSTASAEKSRDMTPSVYCLWTSWTRRSMSFCGSGSFSSACSVSLRFYIGSVIPGKVSSVFHILQIISAKNIIFLPQLSVLVI